MTSSCVTNARLRQGYGEASPAFAKGFGEASAAFAQSYGEANPASVRWWGSCSFVHLERGIS